MNRSAFPLVCGRYARLTFGVTPRWAQVCRQARGLVASCFTADVEAEYADDLVRAGGDGWLIRRRRHAPCRESVTAPTAMPVIGMLG